MPCIGKGKEKYVEYMLGHPESTWERGQLSLAHSAHLKVELNQPPAGVEWGLGFT